MSGKRWERDLARADLCRFLAACYYEPGPEFGEERVFQSMHHAATKVDDGLAAKAQGLGRAYSEEPPEALLVDYTRLFLGPADVPARPYGSWWLTGEKTLMQDATLAILALYHEGGFEMDETFRELPDHVAAELEFLYLLLYRELQARQRGEPHEVRKYERLRRGLLAEHLGRWAGPFAAAIEQNAETEFYRKLAELTRLAVDAEVRDAA